MKNKKIFLFSVLILIIISFLSVKYIHAESGSGYFYWTGKPSNEIGPFAKIGVDSSDPDSCLFSFSKITSGKKSSSCYWGNKIAVSGVSPTSGKIGDMVTITGLGFLEGNTNKILFNGKESSSFSVLSSEKIKAVVPEGATSGYIKITSPTRGESEGAFFRIEESINISGSGENEEKKYDETYQLLAPIGDFKEFKTDDIGRYLNILVKLAIGLCGALAVIMIIINGVMYMGEGSIFKKAQAKDGITDAIIGLLIALGSWAILNTINPDLLGGSGLSIRVAKLEIVNGPDAGDGTVDPDFNTGNETYSSNIPVSSGVNEAVSKLKNGSTIKSFIANTSSKTMVIEMSDGTKTQSIPINIGMSGYSETGKGVSGDNKTPKGSWKILEIRKAADGKPVFSKNGSNMGATFWLLSPTQNGDRGIGMHGNKTGTLTPTNGCLRLTNSDLLALLPYIKTGTTVIIQ